MQMHDFSEFKAEMIFYAKNYNEFLHDKKVELYWASLKRWEIWDIKRVLKNHVENDDDKFSKFPKIATLIRKLPKLQAENEEDEVVDWEDWKNKTARKCDFIKGTPEYDNHFTRIEEWQKEKSEDIDAGIYWLEKMKQINPAFAKVFEQKRKERELQNANN